MLNRRVGRLPLLEQPADYAAVEKILAEAHDRTWIRFAAYCLMPNHWHLPLWPRQDGDLSEVLRWITLTQPGQDPLFGVTRTWHRALTLPHS
ncbi:MAG: transposase [Nitrospirae bacterium]|nr:transposase [Nitrospirota bacterium]